MRRLISITISDKLVKMKECDVLVIGAGPSGTVAASILKNKGLNVILVEREKFPRFVIGESLLPRCMDNLEKAGLLEAVKKADFQKKFGAKFVMGERTCDFNFSDQYYQGWTWTWQVKRAAFDHILADATAGKGVNIEYETSVVDVKFNADHSSITTVERKNGDKYDIKARFIIDGSGYGRVLPRLLKLDAPSNFPPRSAVFCHFTDERRPGGEDGNRITAIVHQKDLWIWVIPFSDGTTSVGFVGYPADLDKYKGDENQQIDSWIQAAPELRDRFANSKKMMPARKITAFSISVKNLYGPGYALTGNSTEFLDPIFSSGVTFATESGALAGELVSRQLGGEAVDWDKEYSAYIKKGVDVFRTYVQAWYDGRLHTIFFHPNSNETIKRQICSVLAGYVWDETNPYVKRHEKAIDTLYNVVKQMANR